MKPITEMRLKSGLTQMQVATMLNIDRSTVAKWESGKALPRPRILAKLAVMYNCTIEELLRERPA